ncbi:MAG: ATP-binding cassette domain-containing protein, partial [Proteobacteria bacterium]|nr:ATP-binding cassette domain-containing protein [Pseudomonadota bacterium]
MDRAGGTRAASRPARQSDRPVLDGLDVAVSGGEMVGVVGPNGSGKTTLLRLISGVL